MYKKRSCAETLVTFRIDIAVTDTMGMSINKLILSFVIPKKEL